MKRIIPALLGLFVFFSLTFPAKASIPVEETLFTEGGSVYEVNLDSDGRLWISDWWVGEVWRVNPLTGEYTKYGTGGSPADARGSGDWFWWVDSASNLVYRADISTGEYTSWEVENAVYLYGTALDTSQPDLSRIWVTDWSQAYIYRLTVYADGTSAEVCNYELPFSGMTNYLAFKDPYLLIGDYLNERLLLLNVNDDSYVRWVLPYGSSPANGLVIDEQGDLWYADLDKQLLAELDPDTDILTSYSIPLVSRPLMLSIQGTRVWYTDEENIGALDTTAADSTQVQLYPYFGTLTPDCGVGLYETGAQPITTATGTFDWTPGSYDTTIDADGWQIFQIPPDGTYPDWLTPNPWGIVYQNGKVWVADNGRQKLIQIDAPPETATVEACKLKDADGDSGTMDDRTPVAGWEMTLYKNDTLVSAQLTEIDGCTLWSGLELGGNYRVVESTQDGWTPLTAEECTLGVISQSDRYSCEFVNYQETSYVFLPLILR